MFQFVLSDKLKAHLEKAASGEGKQPVVYDATKMRMYQLPDYNKSADADNITVFHGREVR